MEYNEIPYRDRVVVMEIHLSNGDIIKLKGIRKEIVEEAILFREKIWKEKNILVMSWNIYLEEF